MKTVGLLTVSILVLLLAGCVTIDQARTNYCESLGSFAQAAAGMRQIDENSTIDDVEDARNEVARAWNDLANSAGNYKDAQYNALEDAYKDFENALDDIPGDATLADAQAIVHESALNLVASYVNIASTTCEYPQAQQMVIQQPQQ
jgi:outer membrane murein-binding lipoprotein Lpp